VNHIRVALAWDPDGVRLGTIEPRRVQGREVVWHHAGTHRQFVPEVRHTALATARVAKRNHTIQNNNVQIFMTTTKWLP
jgi:hypothetical protein